MIQDFNFHCPYCSANLNQGKLVVLNTKRENGDKGVISLDATVGNYEYTHVPEVEFTPGELVDFICPHCNVPLNSKEFEKYALLKLKVDDKISFEVLFSRQSGVQKTYMITEDGIESYSGN
ncbi:hypothetical protein K6119_03230 [Paracrocinitomix mangrovi]|uniref:hypothetical protein n=1 Tax=Paracrocinitomix mangrovi TaxID=2862509 RepID=UPI001C8E0ECD|nr:hypothetical protein [Paracrocinitomix mangrovi]UKN02532.1 hypothetical protein K6119_03230 [Paracrocinitomix mangrovi]